MKNQYDTMTLANLRELAKAKGLKNITSLKKSELIESIMKADSELQQKEQQEKSKDTVTDKSEENLPIHKQIQNNPVQPKTEQKKPARVRTEQVKPGQPKPEQPKPEQAKSESIQADRMKAEHIKVRQPKVEPTIIDRVKREQTKPEQIKSEQPKIERIRPVQNKAEQLKTEYSKPEYSKPELLKEEQISSEVKPDQIQGEMKEESKKNFPGEMDQLDSGEMKNGILEVLPDGYGFIRCDNYLPGENDVYVSPAQIRRFNLKTGDIVAGNIRVRSQNEKFSALLYIKSVNGFNPNEAQKRKRFEDLTPIFPNNRIHLETPGVGVAMRMVDLISPIGKGQRGMIVSQPKAGKTTLLKQIAKAVTNNHPDMKLIILLIDERPEEVTDIKESIEGRNVEVIYSTFDELPENHKRVSEMVIERAKRLVEHKQDVVILLDSITRLARAYNLTVQPSGRTLSGGLDPAALHMPKKFFGAARNMREGGSLTILATALVETGSRMDDVVFEEFKGTGNMELVLDRSLSEKRIFPAIDLQRSSTRRDDLLLTQQEMEATYLMRKALSGMKSDDALERIIDMFIRTKTNVEFIETIKKTKIVY